MHGPRASVLRGALLAGFLCSFAASAAATPLDVLPVDDPLYDEIRALEISGAPVRLPRLGTLPLQIVDLPPLDQKLSSAGEMSRQRLIRSLARDRGLAVPGATPRLLQVSVPVDQRVEFSPGVEAAGTVAESREPLLESGSAVHLRFALQTGRWLAFSDVQASHVEGSAVYSGRLFNNDAVFVSDMTALSYTGAEERWAASIGRQRWHWGPGEEASLILSKTSAAFNALTVRLRIEPLRADAIILNGTLRGVSGEQLAAHRLEWQPFNNLRLGLSEAARYRAAAWQPLYLAGILPYQIVQTLMASDEPDSQRALHNNVIAGVDAAWRIAPGTRAYGELLIDDLRTDDAPTTNKFAYQLGLEGVGTVRGSRVSWGTEFTRLSRYVYTSFYGESFVASDQPIGFPTGPDSRRIRVRAAWDPALALQVFGSAARTDLGESGIDSAYAPGAPRVSVTDFSGVVEKTRQLEIGVRYWPVSGIDIVVASGYVWVDNENHVPDARHREAYGKLSLRLIR